MLRTAPWLLAATAGLMLAAPATGKSPARAMSFDVHYDAAQVATTGDHATFAGRAGSAKLRTAGAVIYDTYPAAGTRGARFTILFASGSVSGTMTASSSLPAGQLDPVIAGGAGRIFNGTGRFHGLVGYVELSDQEGPHSAPAITPDGVHHQTFDICMATKATLRHFCGRAPSR